MLDDHGGHATRSLAFRYLLWNAKVAVGEPESLSAATFAKAVRAILSALPPGVELQPNWAAATAWSNSDELIAFVQIALGRPERVNVADVPDAAESIADFARYRWGESKI